MITLPKHIVKCEYQVEKNLVRRCYAETEMSINNEDKSVVKSLNPFVIEQEGRRILLTSKRDDEIPAGCNYALLINHQINSASFARNDFEIKEWLVHPLMNNHATPEQIVKSWRGKFTFLQEDRETKERGYVSRRFRRYMHSYLEDITLKIDQ